MQKISTQILKLTVILIGLILIGICTYGLPTGIMAENIGGYRQILIGLYAPIVPFFIALYQALRLLDNIEKNKIFSNLSIQPLNYIKYCAFVISFLFIIGMPYIYIVAERDDAPGVILIGLVFVFASFVVGVFSAVIEELLERAIDFKSENDLTV